MESSVSPRWHIQIRIDGPDRIQLSAEVDSAPAMGSPTYVARAEQALARLESWLRCFPVADFEIIVKGAATPAEMHVTPSRFLALYFAAAAIERALGAIPVAPKRKWLSFPSLFRQHDPALSPRSVA